MNKMFRTLAAVLVVVIVIAMGSCQSAYARTYYNNHITAEQAAKADAIAKSIADSIMSNKAYTTDLDRVSAAAHVVAQYAAKGRYGADENKYYRTPYGLFVTGNFTCAGTTRSLGRVLEFMGYEWTHVNENEWLHQWNVLYMDGRIGYADAAVIPTGRAGYGEYREGIEMVNEARARER